jgi:hypothetical protein
MAARTPKLRSKLERLRIRDDIADFLRKAPLRDMVEDQVGNHVYSGKGKIRIGNSYVPVIVRVRMAGGEFIMILKAPSIGVTVKCPFEPKEAARAVSEAVQNNLN